MKVKVCRPRGKGGGEVLSVSRPCGVYPIHCVVCKERCPSLTLCVVFLLLLWW